MAIHKCARRVLAGVALVAFAGCSAGVSLEQYAQPEQYTVQFDANSGRYRVLFPDGDDIGVRFETFEECEIAIWLACKAAQETLDERRMSEYQRQLDENADWKTLDRNRDDTGAEDREDT